MHQPQRLVRFKCLLVNVPNVSRDIDLLEPGAVEALLANAFQALVQQHAFKLLALAEHTLPKGLEGTRGPEVCHY